MNNGEKTANFASGLKKTLPNGYSVYYDHGKKGDPFVCACKGVLGETLSNKTRIADFDIVIIKGDKVKMIIEIEESGTLSPKKVIGYYFALAFIDSIFLKDNKPLTVDGKTKRIIAGLVNENGNSKEKIENIERKIKETCQVLPQIKIIKCSKDSELFEELKRQITAYCK